MTDDQRNRRPIKTRSSPWAQRAAAWLARSKVSPDQISLFSIVFAAAGAAALLWYPRPLGWLVCAACIQGRLLCNLLDGMVAVEGGKQTSLGQLYNEFPDRVTDFVFIIALGYAVSLPWLGWLGALAAAMTAYVRAFGGALGLPQDFRGPMAKPQRMAVMTGGCVLGAIEQAAFGTIWVPTAASVLIALGSLVTCATRSRAIAAQLRRNRS